MQWQCQFFIINRSELRIDDRFQFSSLVDLMTLAISLSGTLERMVFDFSSSVNNYSFSLSAISDFRKFPTASLTLMLYFFSLAFVSLSILTVMRSVMLESYLN